MNRERRSRLVLSVVAVALLGVAVVVQAQARSDYLIRLLQNSDTFRVRAQAAISLGRVEANPTVVRALTGALRDGHPAVRTAAAASLERLADPTALSALQGVRRDRDPAVRRAVASAIRALERVARTRPRTEMGGGNAGGGDTRYYVGVGVPGAKQARIDRAALARARAVLEREIASMDGVEVAPESETNATARRVIQRRRLTGYYIDSSVVSLETEGGNTRAVVSVILGTYPGRDMRAILQGRATVPGATDEQARQQALEGALRGAIRRLPQAFAAADRR